MQDTAEQTHFDSCYFLSKYNTFQTVSCASSRSGYLKIKHVPLEAATYYVSYVPIAFPWGWIVALNVLTIGVSMLILLLPSMIITKISPAKVMHFE